MMRQRRCTVNAAVLAPNYGKTLTVGQVVDLDERLPGGGTLADVTHPGWFEDVEAAEAGSKVRRRTPLHDDMATPAGPAVEE